MQRGIKGSFIKCKSQHSLPNCFVFARRTKLSYHIVTGQRRLRNRQIWILKQDVLFIIQCQGLKMFRVVCLTLQDSNEVLSGDAC